MNIDSKALSGAVVHYVGYGSELSPRSGGKRFLDIYGSNAHTIITEVEKILREASSVPVDWKVHDLVSAGKMVRSRMHDAHPDLSEEALNAIEWKFTFDWR